MNPFEERKKFLSQLKLLKPSNKKTAKTPPPSFVKCHGCQAELSMETLLQKYQVCPHCGYHFPITSTYRLKTIFDSPGFRELFSDMKSSNPLGFSGYDEKLASVKETTGLNEAIVVGTGKINGNKAVVCAMDSRFLMGSMGCIVGEKITLATEFATKKRLPLIIFCASGGARMQEGILSLFQMAKTAAAIKAHADAGLLYISVLTHPTTGGVTASFASLSDIILAEPKALIGFAGPRVIKETIHQNLPEGFQRSEYLLEHGFVDAIVPRKDMKTTLSMLLQMHQRRQK